MNEQGENMVAREKEGDYLKLNIKELIDKCKDIDLLYLISCLLVM